MEQELFTTKEIASFLKCSKKTVENWIKDGRIKSIKLGTHLVRIRKDDFKDFISSAPQHPSSL